MPIWTRDTALLRMTSPLGGDSLIPITLTAQEAISQPFYFEVDAVCQTGQIDPNDLLNKSACVLLQSGARPIRYFHGVVQSMVALGPVRGRGGEFELYRLVLVPRLWFLGQTVDCRVYENQSVSDILQAMFTDAGLTDVSGPPSSATREYTVQFNESDLHFASRLMEEEGWFYYFHHEDTKHTLVIVNQNSSFPNIPHATLCIGDGDGPPLTGFSLAAATVRGKMKHKDYDPENPNTLLQNEQPTTLQTSGAPTRDDFRWPALTFDNGTVTDRAKWQMEAAEAVATVYDGATQFGGIVPGGKFKVESRPVSSCDGSYVVRSATHHGNDDTWLNQTAIASYSNRFTCIPASVTWRQPLETPRPRMDGIHTALVLGPQHGKDAAIRSQDGEEIYTDDLARVKVRFYWDHRGEATGGNAVWARVVQPWAGKGWGAQFIPRVGTEVAVAFVDGDPDRPIVIGGLYNGRDTPIYSKADKTKSGFRTRSTLKGGASEFNEYTFDDKKGSELIYEQAQKDLKTYVKNDQTLTIDNCRIVTVKKDETVDIQNNQTIKVKQDHSLTVTDGNRSIAVSKGNNNFSVDQGNHDVKIGMGNHTTDVKMGNVSLKADLGAINNEAMQSIELKVGESSITIDQMGVTIKGMMISIEGQVQTQLKGLMTQVSADAMLQIQGAITMIN
ncbi:MAG TPA: type VI secretion system tip protein TssI/VgrG [Acetobacteraceae bacterium]